MIEPVDIASMTGSDANRLWELIKNQPVFDDFAKGRGDIFAQRLAAPDTVLYRYKDMALMTVEHIVPQLSGVVHFFLLEARPRESELVGAAIEAMSQVMARFELHRLTATIPWSNKVALRLATRAGFRYEGMLREAFRQNGRYQDVTVYGLLKRDLDSRRVN